MYYGTIYGRNMRITSWFNFHWQNIGIWVYRDDKVVFVPMHEIYGIDIYKKKEGKNEWVYENGKWVMVKGVID